MCAEALALLRQQEPWFVSLAILGALYVAAVAYRLLHTSGLALCLRGPKDLRRRYGAWAVVTGPTSGIGRSMALELARRGLNLVLVGRDPGALQDIAGSASDTHGVLTKTVQFDFSLVSTPQGEEAMGRLRQAVERLEVGVLVNNAGVATPHATYLHEADAEAWVRMIRVNLWAVTEVTAAVLPGMVERGRGAVVNIGSGAAEALPSYPLYSVYAATKRYVAQFSRSLYVEYRGRGIDVQCQAPLYVDTKMVTNMVTRGGLLSRLIMPTSDAYAGAAARWIGHRRPVCMPNVGHRLQWCLCHFVPDRALAAHRLRENLRQRAVFQLLRSSSGEGIGGRR
ncbi:very-long-chain 3-oxoacyl-CoA reductase 1-like [Aegilops tauschii subsp. strangulata]|nr:very-long-chain 3-oxoacyl-CoA reductase 1-like [Aegilops tauschii subsp. strangulata]